MQQGSVSPGIKRMKLGMAATEKQISDRKIVLIRTKTFKNRHGQERHLSASIMRRVSGLRESSLALRQSQILETLRTHVVVLSGSGSPER